ncbi:MAG: hypothetical protein ACYCS1_10520 [Gammaproteobacteria bacterium]
MRSKPFTGLIVTLVLMSLTGCATVGVSRIPKLDPSNTISVLSLLPNQASVLVRSGTFSNAPMRGIPATSWAVNAHVRHWALRQLEQKKRFRVIAALPQSVRQWLSNPLVRQGIELTRKTLSQIKKPVTRMKTNLVLAVVPKHLFITGVETSTIFTDAFIPVTPILAPFIGALAGGPERPKGLGYGVVQGELLDTRSATHIVALKVWLLDRKAGTMIAQTARANLASTKTEILALTRKALGRCLRHLQLGGEESRSPGGVTARPERHVG